MATSTLNPNAPIFVPSAYRAVEDFSDQWWDLVHSSPWFRHYWLQEHCDDYSPANSQVEEPLFDDIYCLPDDHIPNPARKVERGTMDLISLGALKWRKPRGMVETAKYWDKAPKIVNVRVSPRPIKQPR